MYVLVREVSWEISDEIESAMWVLNNWLAESPPNYSTKIDADKIKYIFFNITSKSTN